MKSGRRSRVSVGTNTPMGKVGKRKELTAEELRRRARAVLLYYEEVHGIKTNEKAIP